MRMKLGKMLHEIREKSGVSGKDIAKGILSTADLSRLENGEKEVDIIILETLFERLGKSLDKFELAIGSNEYELINIRMRITYKLMKYSPASKNPSENKQVLDSVQLFLDRYKEKSQANKPIHKQYILEISAIIKYVQEKDEKETLRRLQKALKITQPKAFEESMPLCNQEIQLICMIAYLQINIKEYSKTEIILEKLEKYIDSYYSDGEERVKVYPQCAFVYGKLLYCIKDYRKAYIIVEKGLKVLAENGSTVCIRELLNIKMKCAEILNDSEAMKICSKYITAFECLYEISDIEYQHLEILSLLESSLLRECINSSEFLKELRKANKISQETLSEDICTWETLSRIESGRNLQKKNLYRLWKKIGIQRERYYGQIEAEHYELYEKVRLCNRNMGQDRMEKAYQLIDELEQELDMTLIPNKQYIESAKIERLAADKKITNEEAIEQLKSILYLSMPPVKSGELVYRCPFRVEFDILNQIARRYKFIGNIEKAISIYEMIYEKNYDEEMGMLLHMGSGLVLYTNYEGCLERNKELKKAEEIGMEGIKFLLQCKKGDIAGIILANMSCIYEKKKIPSLEERYLRNSYYLMKFYNEEYKEKVLKSIYISKFGNDLI